MLNRQKLNRKFNMTLIRRLNLGRVRALAMTPQLQQAMGLLQLSNLGLSNYVENVIEKNPLLERNDVLENKKPCQKFSLIRTHIFSL